MFCAFNGQHYELTCFHVGCATDENRLNAAFNKVEDVQMLRNALPAYESYAKNSNIILHKVIQRKTMSASYLETMERTALVLVVLTIIILTTNVTFCL
jgi:hypothetical protein